MDMAPSPMPEPVPQLPSPSPHRPNLRNPLPLSAAQEAQVRDLYYKKVRLRCDAQIKDFADCARGRTITATWLCRTQRLAMNSCMIASATPTVEDKAREEWYAGREERRKKREEESVAVEKRRVEVIDLTKHQEEKENREKEVQKTQEVKKSTGWWK